MFPCHRHEFSVNGEKPGNAKRLMECPNNTMIYHIVNSFKYFIWDYAFQKLEFEIVKIKCLKYSTYVAKL